MGQIHKVETSPEVYSVIRARHKDMVVFGGCCHPSGDPNGDPDEGYIYTEYGLKESYFPLVSTDIRWDIDHDKPSDRQNLRAKYWLFAYTGDD